MTTTTGKPAQITTADALRQILAEVTPGIRPYSTDSYLPNHLIEQAVQALDRHSTADDHAGYQHAFNAMSAASWHIARGDAPAALGRIRRAQSHITATMQGRD